MKLPSLRDCAALLAAVLISSLFFLGLYRFDNKYSQDTVQAADGILALSEEDLRQQPLRFLVSGWAFYPDALLSPEEIRSGSHYMRYLSVGEQTGLSGASGSSPYGCGTYQLTFFLPGNVSGYALELPEVFSAYTLWINDTPVLTLGDPAAGKSEIQNRLVTFPGGSPVTLTLAVCNNSHFYGGLVYPPAFGTPLAVNTMRAVRFAVCLFSCTVSLLCALLSFYSGFRIRQKNAILFGLVCLFSCGFSSYPFLHMLLALPVFPWYALELVCGYLTAWLILILQNRICQTGFPAAAVSNTLGGVFCLAALLYGLNSGRLTPTGIRLFSASSALFKIAAACFLLASAVSGIRRQFQPGVFPAAHPSSMKAILLSAAAAACALLWDRLLPDYEPIIGGWFAEWGGFFVTAAIGYTLWNSVVQSCADSLIFEQERKQVSRQLAMQTAYSRRIAKAAEENRRLLHDIKHHLRAIGSMAADHGDEDICRFLSQVEQEVSGTNPRAHASFCGNSAVNALLEYYDGAAQAAGATLTVRFSLPDTFPLTDVELCTILGNLLDNAVEACARQKNEERRILLAAETRGQMFFLKVENTCGEPPRRENGRFLSEKAVPGHGIGLSSVKKIVESHGGSTDIRTQDGLFSVGILLNL